MRLVSLHAQQGQGPAVGGGDAPFPVQADHARAHLGQHRLDELAAGFRVGVRPLQGLLLILKIFRHPIESAGQNGDFLGVVVDLDAGVEVAAGDTVGGGDQAGHRGRDAGGGRHAEPHRADQHQKGGLQVAEGEGELDRLAGALGVAPVAHGVGGLGQQRQDAPLLGEARDVEIGVGIGVQAVEAAEQVLGVEVFGVDLALRAGLEGLRRRRGVGMGGAIRASSRVQDTAAAVDQVDGRKAVGRGPANSRNWLKRIGATFQIWGRPRSPRRPWSRMWVSRWSEVDH